MPERHNGGFIPVGPHKLYREDPYFAGGWSCAKTDTGWEYRIKKPEWTFETIVDPVTDVMTLRMREYISEFTSQRWDVEEKILRTSVVDILRSEGYTVIEPEVTDEG